MVGVLIVVAVGLCGALVTRMAWRREPGFKSDLGSVSAQWINEHRLP